MAVAYRIQDLEECLLGHEIVSNIMASLGNTREQITFGAVLQDHVCAVVGIHDGHQRHHVGVMACFMVKLYFPLLELALPWIQADFAQSLDGITGLSVNVDSCINHTIGSYPNDTR